MKNDADVKEYRKEKTLNLIEKYKSLIDDVFKIFDENKQEYISEDDKEETEQKKLEKIKKRSVALDQVDLFLTKIESLEHHVKESQESQKDNTTEEKKEEKEGYLHPTKKRARN
jgi:hypothetical protein